MPLFTPPQTPGHHVNGSTGNLSGIAPVAGTKRESNASESSAVGANVVAGVKREGGDVIDDGVGQENGREGREKKRRIAPTLVSGVEGKGPPPPPVDDDGAGG